MLRRYPYWGWLLISLTLWCISAYHFHQHRESFLPERMGRAVNSELQRQENIFDEFIKDEDLVRRMFSDSLTQQETEQIVGYPFFVFAYEEDSLLAWNTNTIIAGDKDTLTDTALILRNEKGVFIERVIGIPDSNSSKRIVVLFPVVITYPLENDYLKSHFVASSYIPIQTQVIAKDKYVSGDYPIFMHENIPVCYLHFNPDDVQKWVPNWFFIALLISAVFTSLSWIQLMTMYLTRNKSSVTAFFITFFIIVLIRWLLYTYGLPFNLGTLTFFSPLLYASSKYLSSFGDLFINTLCVLWLAVFVARHTPYGKFCKKVKYKPTRYVLAVTLIAALLCYTYLFVTVIRSLVLDSSISFDVSHSYTVTRYTLLGLTVIGIITGISCLIIYLLNVQLEVLIKNKWYKYLLVLVTGIVLLLLTGINFKAENWQLYWALLGWLLLFLILLDIPRLTIIADLFAPRMIFWALFVCFFCTGILQYYNDIKEKKARVAYVEFRLSPNRDNEMESVFHSAADTIRFDKSLKNFFAKPSATNRKLINQRFDNKYLTGVINKYQSNVYLFDAKKRGLFNKDTSIDYPSLIYERDEAAPTSTPYLFYKESILDRRYYLAYIPVYSDTLNIQIGYVFIDLDLKKQATETVNRELLQPIANKENAEDNEYAYAIYVNDKLITQNDDYPFTTHLENDTLREQVPTFYKNHGNVELHYKGSDRRTTVVVHNRSKTIEIITLFSYLFGMEVMIAILILLYQVYLSYFANATSGRLIRLTLRRRVHFSMLGIVLLSFIMIGFFTIKFFTWEYRSSNESKLQSAMKLAKQSVQDYLKRADAYEADNIFDSVIRTNNFKSYITTLAGAQKIDINIFDDKGILFSSSQDDIYEKGLLARIMRPDSYYELNTDGKAIVIQSERIARLSYLSAYEPLRDERGTTLGYINIPFFSSEKELNFQISNIVVTLINVYAFIFLLSSLITVIITRWITGSFNVIIQQFGQINLQQNERIKWPYDDEIGVLVSEYNKMVNKVEENAAMMAQSERESAWRDMARQVAHEIKNPLTPMKLNIQYLQQAIKNDHPDLKGLMNRVSDSIIEQIDNLSYIASEFSNFAKMPEAKPEELELGELLNKATELYLNEADIEVTINDNWQKMYVYSDRSQLLRVITNLLENAKQAIPAGRAGKIEVSLNCEENNAVISISDNGIGISEEAMKRIFQPYFTTKSSGTGLGLAMTKKIIEFWKGEIWFETKEDEGTTFYIRMPLLKSVKL